MNAKTQALLDEIDALHNQSTEQDLAWLEQHFGREHVVKMNKQYLAANVKSTPDKNRIMRRYNLGLR